MLTPTVRNYVILMNWINGHKVRYRRTEYIWQCGVHKILYEIYNIICVNRLSKTNGKVKSFNITLHTKTISTALSKLHCFTVLCTDNMDATQWLSLSRDDGVVAKLPNRGNQFITLSATPTDGNWLLSGLNSTLANYCSVIHRFSSVGVEMPSNLTFSHCRPLGESLK